MCIRDSFSSLFIFHPSFFLLRPLFCTLCTFFQSGSPSRGALDTLYGLIIIIFELYGLDNLYKHTNIVAIRMFINSESRSEPDAKKKPRRMAKSERVKKRFLTGIVF